MFRIRNISVYLVVILLVPSGRGKTIVPRAASSEDLRAEISNVEKEGPVIMEKDKELSSAHRVPAFGQPDLSGNIPVDAFDDSSVRKPAPDYDFREPIDVDYRRESDSGGKPNGILPGDAFENDSGKEEGSDNTHFNEGKFPGKERDVNKEEDDKREEEEEESVAYEDNDGEPNHVDKGTGEDRNISQDEDREKDVGEKAVNSHEVDEKKKGGDDEANKKDFGGEDSTPYFVDKEKSNKDNEGDKKYVGENDSTSHDDEEEKGHKDNEGDKKYVGEKDSTSYDDEEEKGHKDNEGDKKYVGEKDSTSHDDEEEKGNEENKNERKDVAVENSTSYQDDIEKGEDSNDEVVTGVEYEDEIQSAHDLFDTPFFNLRQVSKYFQQLEKAMEHMFSKTMEEASFLNGTFTNTTEEDVKINGKTYHILKSLMKAPDSKNSLYIETLSPKSNKTDVSQE